MTKENKILRVGLIGCGHLGSIHAELISKISAGDKSVIFAGVYDTDASKSSAISSKYGARSFDSADSLLSGIDALVIVTPTSTHFEIAGEAISREIDLFIEKPVTSTVEQAMKLVEMSRGRNIKIQVGHVERFNPALLSLAEFDLKPLFIESHRLSQFNPRGTDVSVIQDLMIHDIDIILSLVKSPVKKIDANGVAVISKNIDIANARLGFDNGCVANLTASRISLKKMRKMRIFQQSAYISVDFLKNKSEIFRLTEDYRPADGLSFPLGEGKKIIYEEPKMPNAEDFNPIRNELESFIASIRKDTPVKVPLDDGKEAVVIAEEIIRKISETQIAG